MGQGDLPWVLEPGRAQLRNAARAGGCQASYLNLPEPQEGETVTSNIGTSETAEGLGTTQGAEQGRSQYWFSCVIFLPGISAHMCWLVEKHLGPTE